MAVTALNLSETGSTNQTSNLNYTKQVDWIVPVTITIILIILTLWILLSLVHYGVKTNIWHFGVQSSPLDNMMSVGLIYTTVVVCAVMTLCCIIVNLVYLNVGFNQNDSNLCDNIADTAIGFYAWIVFFVNLFYWLRQRVFFKNKMLNIDYNKILKLLSSFSIIIIFIGGLSSFIVNIYPNNRIATNNGCLFQPQDNLRPAFWVPFIVVIILGQGMIFGLFVYALKKCSDFAKQQTEILKDDKQLSSVKVIKLTLKKTLVFAVISTIADFFNQIFIHYIVDPNENRRFVTLVSNVNAFLNVLFLVLSFVNYKEILSSLWRSDVKN